MVLTEFFCPFWVIFSFDFAEHGNNAMDLDGWHLRQMGRRKIHLISHALHYGSGVFEGTRFYETPKERLFFDYKIIRHVYFTLLLPFGFQSILVKRKLMRLCVGHGEKMGLRLLVSSSMIWRLVPWGKHLADRPIHVKISKYIRIHPKKSYFDAKVTDIM